MPIEQIILPQQPLLKLGINNLAAAHYQLSPQELTDDSLRLGQGILSNTGALVIHTGEFTGRTPKDKFFVKDETVANTIFWNDFNQPIAPEYFDIIYDKIIQHFNKLNEYWVRDCYACADENLRLKLRVINEKPANNLFAHNMFIRPGEEDLENFAPHWHILSAPGLKLKPSECGTRSSNAVLISFSRKMILIAGSGYTGEIKKGIFTILNYILPTKANVLSMHCSANIGKNGDTAIFFGLSGTGKTTLSADPERKLIGDDEHGWGESTVFNFEGGCYAKTINLCEEKEPEIYKAIRPGALVENVCFYPNTNSINFDDSSISENTRVSYPIHFISNAIEPSIGGIPKNIFFLTCDAFGILPPISKLSTEQAMYQFISGYTAKIAGTEAGITEPKPTFSACFGAPFLPLHPGQYAKMLGQKLKQHQTNVWLINTGWTGGSYGTGSRINLSYTRAMINAVLNGLLDGAKYIQDEIFGLNIPTQCPGVPDAVLNPKSTWSSSEAYEEKAKYLAGLFIQNFAKYAEMVTEDIIKAAPKLDSL